MLPTSLLRHSLRTTPPNTNEPAAFSLQNNGGLYRDVLMACRLWSRLHAVYHHHAALVSMRSNAWKTKMTSTLIPSEQRQAVLLAGEPSEEIY